MTDARADGKNEYIFNKEGECVAWIQIAKNTIMYFRLFQEAEYFWPAEQVSAFLSHEQIRDLV